MSQGTILYPNVTALPPKTEIVPQEQSKRKSGVPTEFDQVFDQTMIGLQGRDELDQIKAPVRFSAHATQRLQDRKIAIDSTTMAKISDAVDKAEAKGVEDTLILTSDLALIVSVPHRTVITAMDRKSAAGNIFTNIDGAVVV